MNPVIAKSVLLWAGSKHNISMLRSPTPALQLGSDTVTANDHVQVLGVTISSDLSLEKHVSKTKTCAACFYTGFANFVVSESHLTMNQWQRSYMLS